MIGCRHRGLLVHPVLVDAVNLRLVSSAPERWLYFEQSRLQQREFVSEQPRSWRREDCGHDKDYGLEHQTRSGASKAGRQRHLRRNDASSLWSSSRRRAGRKGGVPSLRFEYNFYSKLILAQG